MFVTRLAKSSAIVTRLRNPAMTTSSTWAVRQWSRITRLNSSCDAKPLAVTTAVGMPASRANCSPRAVGLLEITSADLKLQSPGLDLLDQVLQRRAAAGNEHGNAEGIIIEWHGKRMQARSRRLQRDDRNVIDRNMAVKQGKAIPCGRSFFCQSPFGLCILSCRSDVSWFRDCLEQMVGSLVLTPPYLSFCRGTTRM